MYDLSSGCVVGGSLTQNKPHAGRDDPLDKLHSGQTKFARNWHFLTSKLQWLIKDPLVHFAILGLLLFFLLPNEEGPSARTINVNRQELIEFMQGRVRIFDGRKFSEIYDNLDPEQRSDLLQDYVRQEALYREAMANNLDQADPLIRRRLVQQMELLMRDEAVTGPSASDENIAAYFEANRANYIIPASAHFTHVFISREKHGEQSGAIAQEMLAELSGDGITPEASLQWGDRFPYQRNYADIGEKALIPELGAEVARAVFTQGLSQWSGPFRSGLGEHLVFVTRREEEGAPTLASIRERVEEDALSARQQTTGQKAIDRLLASYEIEISSDIGPLTEGAR